jgi:hypothetical protein
MPPKDLHELAEHLNEVLSDYLQGAEPGTQDREGALLRYRWFTDVAATADHLQQLLQPVDQSALLLSGVGQPVLLFLSTKSVPLAEWEKAVSRTVAFMGTLKSRAQAGQETIGRELFEVEIDFNGWTKNLNTRRMGRPTDCYWAALADELMVAWRFMTRSEPKVTVDPMTDPPTHRSAAATFAAALLDLVAGRLPPEKAWAVDRLRRQEAKLIDHLEGQQAHRRFRRQKRKKSAPR